MIGTVLDRRYRLLAQLGEGAMGQVFRAEHLALGRTVAVKVIASQLAARDDVRARFLREARAQALITHPHVVATLDFGDAGGQLYLVLEHVTGESLERIVAGGPLDVGRALALAIQIADGLAAAHALGIVHRDVKPANVLVSPSAGGELAKITDFGLAMLEHELRLTSEGSPLGTPGYLAPEQAMGRRVDARADVYALGCTLFELLAGRLPFEGTGMEVLVDHINTPAPRLVDLDPRFAGDLDALVAAMLAKAPADRPADASVVAARLRAIATSRIEDGSYALAVVGELRPALERAIAMIVEAAGGEPLAVDEIRARFSDGDAAVRAAAGIARLAGRHLRVAVDVGSGDDHLRSAAAIARAGRAGCTTISARVHAALSLGARGRFAARGVIATGALREPIYQSSPGEPPASVGGARTGADVVFECPCGGQNRIPRPYPASRYDASCGACGGSCRVECAALAAAEPAGLHATAPFAIALPTRACDDDRRVLSELGQLE